MAGGSSAAHGPRDARGRAAGHLDQMPVSSEGEVSLSERARPGPVAALAGEVLMGVGAGKAGAQPAFWGCLWGLLRSEGERGRQTSCRRGAEMPLRMHLVSFLGCRGVLLKVLLCSLRVFWLFGGEYG